MQRVFIVNAREMERLHSSSLPSVPSDWSFGDTETFLFM